MQHGSKPCHAAEEPGILGEVFECACYGVKHDVIEPALMLAGEAPQLLWQRESSGGGSRETDWSIATAPQRSGGVREPEEATEST